MSVKVDTQGDLWISPYGKGLDRYIDGGRKQKHYDVSNSDLTNNVILDIEERDGSLWLATDGGGISLSLIHICIISLFTDAVFLTNLSLQHLLFL